MLDFLKGWPCRKCKEKITLLKKQVESLKAEVARKQAQINKTNSYYKKREHKRQNGSPKKEN